MRNARENKLPNYNVLAVVESLLQVGRKQLDEFVADFKFAEHDGMAEEDAGRMVWASYMLDDIVDTLSDIYKRRTGEEE